MTRVWRRIYEPYRKIGKEAGIATSDFISLVLYHVAFDEPLITYVLQNEFEMSFNEAREFAKKLADLMEEQGKMIWGEEELA